MVGLAVLLSGLTVGLVSAQDQAKQPRQKQNQQEMAAQRADRMKKELNLTDDQMAQMKNLQASMAQDRQQMQKSMQDVRKDFREKMKVHNEAVQKILTPEQFAKYQQRMSRMEGYRMGMRDGRRMSNRPPMHHRMQKPASEQQSPANTTETGQQPATSQNN